MSETDGMITVEYGYVIIEPVKYRIIGGEVSTRWWQRRREEWFVVSEFGSTGPFDTKEEAATMLALCGKCPTAAIPDRTAAETPAP